MQSNSAPSMDVARGRGVGGGAYPLLSRVQIIFQKIIENIVYVFQEVSALCPTFNIFTRE